MKHSLMLTLTLVVIATFLSPQASAGFTMSDRYERSGFISNGTNNWGTTDGTVFFISPVRATTVTLAVEDVHSSNVAFHYCIDIGNTKGVCGPGDNDYIRTGVFNVVTVSFPDGLPAGTLIRVQPYLLYAHPATLAVGVATTGIVSASFA